MKRRVRELTEQVCTLSEGLERVDELEEQLRVLAATDTGACEDGGTAEEREA